MAYSSPRSSQTVILANFQNADRVWTNERKRLRDIIKFHVRNYNTDFARSATLGKITLFCFKIRTVPPKEGQLASMRSVSKLRQNNIDLIPVRYLMRVTKSVTNMEILKRNTYPHRCGIKVRCQLPLSTNGRRHWRSKDGEFLIILKNTNELTTVYISWL